MNRLRLFISRYIGFFIPPVGRWEAHPHLFIMRRLSPRGEWEFRPMSEAEVDEEQKARAW